MLINIDNINQTLQEKERKGFVFSEDEAENDTLIIPRKQSLIDAFGTLEKNKNYHFATAGRWSQYEVLNFILAQSGPADVFLTTWKINDLSANNIFNLIKAGVILNLFTVLEKRIPITSPTAKDTIVTNATNHLIADNHSKVIVVINDEWKVSVNGSANMTINPRIEAGVLSTVESVADFHKNWILNEINNGDTFHK